MGEGAPKDFSAVLPEERWRVSNQCARPYNAEKDGR